MSSSSPAQPPARAVPGTPYVVLIVALLMTALAAIYVFLTTNQRNRLRFEHSVDQAKEEIVARMDAYASALRGGAGLFAAHEARGEMVGRDQFRAYVERLDIQHRYPGVLGLGYAARLLNDRREQIVNEIRALRPDAPNPADDAHAVIYLEPLDDQSLPVIGYDMFAEPTRRAAMERARDSGAPALSGRVTLSQIRADAGRPQQSGFFIYVPVYRHGNAPETIEQRRDALLGFVFSPFRADDLFTGLLAQKMNSLVRVDVFDGLDALPTQLLHQGARDVGYPAMFTGRRTIQVAGRWWLLNFSSLPSFEVESGRDLTPFVLLVGGVVAFSLFLMTRAQARARGAAERMAAELRITDRALRYSESRFRRLAESNLIGVVFSDVHGAVADGNDAYFRLIGSSRDDALAGRVRWDLLTPPEWKAADERALEELRRTGVATPFEKEYLRPDGTRVPVLIGVAMLAESSTDTVAFTVDLTERKRAERELRLAKESAEAANRAKDQFLAVLSHELRTPLTPVLALATASQNDPALDEELRSDFAMIRRNVDLEAKLIDDLLDLTKIGRGKVQLQLEDVDVHQVVRAAMNVCMADEIAIKHHAVTMKLDASAHHVRGDAARLQQVFWNLVKNAAKFTPAAGGITVRSWNEPRTRRLCVSISDTGIGIEPEMLPRIFDAFEQGEPARSRVYGGLGLGLAISKGLVEAHGGTITAQSEGRDRGSTFTIAIDSVAAPSTQTATISPLASQRPPRPESPAPARSERVSILLVEDHADTARALSRLLTRIGYDVRAADSVAAALNIAAQTDFDVLVSDLGLPDGSGLDLIRELSRHPTRARGPIKAIALTGFGMEEDVAQSMKAGFHEHLTKPVNLQTLQSAIERVCSQAEST